MDALVSKIDDFLKIEGYKKKKNRWFRESREFYFVIELQKSRFSKIFYLNYGFFFKKLGVGAFDFTAGCCHLAARLYPFQELKIADFSDEDTENVFTYISDKVTNNLNPLIDKITNADDELLNKISKWEVLEAQYVTHIEVINHIKTIALTNI